MCDDKPVSALYRRAKPGDIITFGRYLQTADGADRTPIQWQVLHNSGSELFILSAYIVDCKRYHAEYVAITCVKIGAKIPRLIRLKIPRTNGRNASRRLLLGC